MFMALRDALQTARVRLAEEVAAVALLRERGFATDLAVAERERDHYAALVARLEQRLAAAEGK